MCLVMAGVCLACAGRWAAAGGHTFRQRRQRRQRVFVLCLALCTAQQPSVAHTPGAHGDHAHHACSLATHQAAQHTQPASCPQVKPSAKLDTLRISLRPTDAELAPLATPRDTLWEGRVTHRLLLTYKLSLAEAGKVTPTLPALNRWAGVRGVGGCCGRAAGLACAALPCKHRTTPIHVAPNFLCLFSPF